MPQLICRLAPVLILAGLVAVPLRADELEAPESEQKWSALRPDGSTNDYGLDSTGTGISESNLDAPGRAHFAEQWEELEKLEQRRARLESRGKHSAAARLRTQIDRRAAQIRQTLSEREQPQLISDVRELRDTVRALKAEVARLPADLRRARARDRQSRLLTVARLQKGNSDLVTIDETGKELQQLTSGIFAIDPAWSPDGKRLAFVSLTRPGGQICVMNADGSEMKVLVSDLQWARSPAWSPNGVNIAFTGAKDANKEIMIMTADGGDLTTLTNDPRLDADPAWSPDGTKIAFTSERAGGCRLFVMNTDGSDVQDLLGQDQYNTLFPAWSPSGRQLLFGGNVAGRSVQLFTVNVDGTGRHRLTEGGQWNSYGAWSADGEVIAYVRFTGPPPPTGEGTGELMLYDVATGEQRSLLRDVPLAGARASWRPGSAAGHPIN